MYRAVKNANNVIIAIGTDENQSGNYPSGSSDLERQGVWCSWTFSEVPAFAPIAGVEMDALRFKENALANGIELRTDAEVSASPKA